MIVRDLDVLRRALEAESWEWLVDERPSLAFALKAEVERGASPDDVRRFVMRFTQRSPLALRLEQAAAYLEGVKE